MPFCLLGVGLSSLGNEMLTDNYIMVTAAFSVFFVTLSLSILVT